MTGASEPMWEVRRFLGVTMAHEVGDIAGLLIFGFWRLFAVAVSIRGRWIDFARCVAPD